MSNSRFTIRLSKPTLLQNGQATWAEMARAGQYLGYRGGSEPFDLTEESLDQICQNFEQGNPCPIYIGHPKTEVPAVGWIRAVKREGDRLLGYLEFTKSMVSKIRGGAFKFLSIECDLASVHFQTGEEIGAQLTALAVTNQPFIRGLQPLSLSAHEGRTVEGFIRKGDEGAIYLEANKGTVMDLEQLKQKLMELLEGASEEELAEALKTLEGNSGSEDVAAAEGAEEGAEEAEAEEGEEAPNALLEALRSALANPEMTEEEALAWIAEMASVEASEEASNTVAASNIKASELDGMKIALSEMKQKNDRLAKELGDFRKAQIEALVNSKIADGTIHAAKRGTYVKLAQTSPDMFKELTGVDVRSAVRLSNLVSVSAVDTANANTSAQTVGEYGKALQEQMNRFLKRKS